MAIPTSTVSIDKVKLSHAYDEADVDGREAWFQFRETVQSMKVFDGVRVKGCREHSWSKLSIRLGPRCGRLFVGYGYARGRLRSSVEWTDSTLSSTGRTALALNLHFLYPDGIETLAATGRVSKIEIASDHPDVSYGNYAFAAQGVSRHDVTYVQAGTTVLGDPRGGTRAYRCYDKGKQLWERRAVLLDHRLTRLEAVLNPAPRLALEQVSNHTNPFAKLFVIPMHALHADTDGKANATPSWLREFRSSVTNGIPAQAAYLSSRNRPALSQHLRMLRPNWFNPEEIWARVPACVTALRASLRHHCL